MPYSTAYSYVPGSGGYGLNATIPLVRSITQGSGANALNFAYTYDNRGNITSETRNGVTTTYEYDALGQLTRVNDPNDPTGSAFGTTWIYTYDRGGNILNKSAYVYTTGTVGTVVRSWAYGYDDPNWKDKLTKFDGSTITYDAIGNPTNDGTWTYTWQAGRQLKSMSKVEGGDTITMEFTYNHAGLRTKKVKKLNGVVTETTEYILNGKNVVELIHINHDTSEVNRLHFYYDAQGRVALVDFNGTKYSYAHNLQGDIIGILDTNGNIVVEYKYDAWGKPLSMTGTLIATVGQLNPFKYRGYIWDRETWLYYLKTRYYNVNWSSFAIIDRTAIMLKGNKLLGRNLFLYAYNNPINMMDKNGEDAIWIQESESAMGFGHSGLMAQDAEGNWFYFFWGPDSEDISKEVIKTGTPNGSFIQMIDVGENDITNIGVLRNVLDNAGGLAASRAGLITEAYYFEGDYVETYHTANNYAVSDEEYSVLFNNCVQKTYYAFLASDSRFFWINIGKQENIIPNNVALLVSMMPSKKSEKPTVLMNLYYLDQLNDTYYWSY